MLYAIIITLFVLLVTVAVKWANTARELRKSKADTQAAMVTISTMVTVDTATAQRWSAQHAAYEGGFKDGLLAARRAVQKASKSPFVSAIDELLEK
jgi:hypothetical protein